LDCVFLIQGGFNRFSLEIRVILFEHYCDLFVIISFLMLYKYNVFKLNYKGCFSPRLTHPQRRAQTLPRDMSLRTPTATCPIVLLFLFYIASCVVRGAGHPLLATFDPPFARVVGLIVVAQICLSLRVRWFSMITAGNRYMYHVVLPLLPIYAPKLRAVGAARATACFAAFN
jgi:hypothetical protein